MMIPLQDWRNGRISEKMPGKKLEDYFLVSSKWPKSLVFLVLQGNSMITPRKEDLYPPAWDLWLLIGNIDDPDEKGGSTSSDLESRSGLNVGKIGNPDERKE